MINNRQNGRRRGRGGGQRTQNGGGGGQGQRDSGNRIDSRARGNASQLYEKYKNMASDAQRQGDRVNTEYYLQFADHYFRVIADQRGRYEDQGQPRRGVNDFDADEDYGDEGDPIRGDEQSRGETDQRDYPRQERYQGQREQGDRDGGRDNAPRDNNYRDANARDGGQRESAQRDGNQRYERPRDSAPREDRDGNQRYDRQRDDGQNDRPRDGAARDDRPRGQRAGYDRGNAGNGAANGERAPVPAQESPRNEQPRRNDRRPAYVAVPAPAYANDEQATPAVEAIEAPKRRGRPRKQPADDAPMLDASVLPPSLGIVAAPESAGDDAPAPKPRRRRAAATDVTQAG